MKKLLLTLVLIGYTALLFAQQGINYKAVIKDGSGNVIANDPIAVQFEIREGTSTGSVVFTETHTPTTDANGLIILAIGSIGSGFDTIDWGSDAHFLNVQVDIGGGLVDLNTTEFHAVPYAKQAESANFKTNSNVTSNGPGDIDNDDFVFGSTQLNHSQPDEGPADTRMFFDKSKGAFRVGSTRQFFLISEDGYVWDESRLGLNSFAFGYNTEAGLYSMAGGSLTRAIGNFSFALGSQTQALGNYSIAIGSSNQALGIYSVAIGNQVNAIGNYSTALGSINQALGSNSVSLGVNNIAYSFAETAIGMNNTTYTIQPSGDTTAKDLDRLFVIGNGTSPSNKSDALRVLKNGTITAPSFDISEITDNKALITKEFADANYIITPFSGDYNDLTNQPTIIAPTGLETLNQGNGIGWRLIGVNPANYGNIGSGAVDLSISIDNSSPKGATGTLAFAAGQDNTAFGYASTALGYNTKANGSQSVSTGSFSTATGNNSTAMGNNTTAIGINSTALGEYTIASANSSTAIGKYNTADSNGLFIIGNGTWTADRNNALVIKESGDAIFDGEIQHTSTGNANMIPIAYGTIDSAGNILSGTGNFSVTTVATPTFQIDVLGETLSHTNSSTLVTPLSGVFRTASISHLNGDIRVHIFSSSGTQVINTFQFVIYRL